VEKMQVIKSNKIRVNGQDVAYFKIDNDYNGNPRYVIHFLEIDNDYNKAINKAREIGGKVYKAKWFGGGIVIQSYSLETDLEHIISK
jgi:hypothetical protein